MINNLEKIVFVLGLAATLVFGAKTVYNISRPGHYVPGTFRLSSEYHQSTKFSSILSGVSALVSVGALVPGKRRRELIRYQSSASSS